MTKNITINDLDFYILAHNRAGLLAETIKSILNQTVLPEYITVLDNESTEDVEGVVKSFENKGLRYVKTFGRHGNYLKSKELASKKYVIRFHDDNLIHPEFIEKMLVALNSTDNISAVTSTFTTIYETEEANYHEDYKTPKHLLNYFVIMNNPKDFVYHRIRSNVYPKSVWVSGTPFMAVKTELFKEFDAIKAFEKYAKADDINFFIHCCEKGKLLCMADSNCAFFRMHNENDTVSDENSLSLEQIKNLTAVMSNTIKEDRDEDVWRDFLEFTYYIYPDATKNSVVKSLPVTAFIEQLFIDGIFPDFVRPIYKKYSDIKKCIDSKKVPKVKLPFYKRLFSIKSEYRTPFIKWTLHLLGIKISFKIKKLQH